jgi:hypothetical protein
MGEKMAGRRVKRGIRDGANPMGTAGAEDEGYVQGYKLTALQCENKFSSSKRSAERNRRAYVVAPVSRGG